VKVLLDENFPLGLVRALEADGLHVEHVITLGWRGTSDARIRTRLSNPDVLFLTQDEDFLFGELVAATVVVSRVRQARRLTERIEVWRRAVAELVRTPEGQRLFELTDEGVLVPWRHAGPEG
jgi:predicted nuclease of predicted toxin-antitoxin system